MNNKMKDYYLEDCKFNRKALTEVYELLRLDEESVEKIPLNIWKIIEDNRDVEYEIDIENLDSNTMMTETKDIIIWLYMDYLAPEEEKNVLENMAKLQYEQKQKEKQEQYKINVFNSEKQEHVEEIQKINLPVEYKESIIKKILKFIKKVFKK